MAMRSDFGLGPQKYACWLFYRDFDHTQNLEIDGYPEAQRFLQLHIL